MARKLRIQFTGARYHIINRGDDREAVFGDKRARQAFLKALAETQERHGWLVFAYTVLPNSFHLAIETPEPNLSAGMHWLQTTFSTRHNRQRMGRGHLFQGRYRSVLLEDAVAVRRVADYIHLCPVRGGVVTSQELATYLWSSLAQRSPEPEIPRISPELWMDELGYRLTSEGWQAYEDHLAGVATAEPDDEVIRSWALGSWEWKAQVVAEHGQPSAVVGAAWPKWTDFQEEQWEMHLVELLSRMGKTEGDLAGSRQNADWKLALAHHLKTEHGAKAKWLGARLHMGSPEVVRVYFNRYHPKGIVDFQVVPAADEVGSDFIGEWD